MAAQCDPASNIQVHSGELNGSFDTVPSDETFYFLWGTAPGGPYPNMTPANNGNAGGNGIVQNLSTNPSDTSADGSTDPDWTFGTSLGSTPNAAFNNGGIGFDFPTAHYIGIAATGGNVPTGNTDIFWTRNFTVPAGATNITFTGSQAVGDDTIEEVFLDGVPIPGFIPTTWNNPTAIPPIPPIGPGPHTFQARTTHVEAVNPADPTGVNIELLLTYDLPLVPGVQNLNEPISGLAPGTTYYYVAVQDDGVTPVQSTECQFTTLTHDILCNPATNIGVDSATLNGQGDFVLGSEGLRIVWGTTPGGPYPNVAGSVVGTDTDDQVVSFPIGGLTPNVTYYYRTEVTNPGVEGFSAECSFIISAATEGFFWCGTFHPAGTPAIFVTLRDGSLRGGYWRPIV